MATVTCEEDCTLMCLDGDDLAAALDDSTTSERVAKKVRTLHIKGIPKMCAF